MVATAQVIVALNVLALGGSPGRSPFDAVLAALERHRVAADDSAPEPFRRAQPEAPANPEAGGPNATEVAGKKVKAKGSARGSSSSSSPRLAIPAIVRPDCSVDATAELTNWIASAPDGATLDFASGACYRVDGTIKIYDRSGLTFNGNGATIKAMTDGDQVRRHLWFFGGSNLKIQNLTVRGANPNAGTSDQAWRSDRAFQHAFALQGVQGAVLDNVSAYDVYGDFVYIGSDSRVQPKRWSKGIVVRNSTFQRNGRQGIGMSAGEDITIENNYFSDVRMDVFDLEGDVSSQGARRVRIVGNRSGAGKLLWLAIGGNSMNVSDIYVARNRTEASNGGILINPPAGARWGPITIENNSLWKRSSPNQAFKFTRTDNVMFRGNYVVMPGEPLGSNMNVVAIFESAHVRVVNNQISGAFKNILEADAASSDYLEENNTRV